MEEAMLQQQWSPRHEVMLPIIDAATATKVAATPIQNEELTFVKSSILSKKTLVQKFKFLS